MVLQKYWFLQMEHKKCKLCFLYQVCRRHKGKIEGDNVSVPAEIISEIQSIITIDIRIFYT